MSSVTRRPQNPDGPDEPPGRIPLVWVVILALAGLAGVVAYHYPGLGTAIVTAVTIVGLMYVIVRP